MLDHASELVELAESRDRDDLETDRLFGLAVVRLLEVLGEAANRVDAETRAAHSDIPWAQLVGLRNRLIHGYDQVDYDIVWRIVRTDLPDLVARLRRLP